MKISLVRRLLSVQVSTDEGCRLDHSSINTLSDDVLLCIFDSYRREWRPRLDRILWAIWPWTDLVHVCRRWRRIVFASPRYLKLYLTCKSKPDVQAALDIWPALPLDIHANFDDEGADEDDIIGTLKHHDRLARIQIEGFNRYRLEKCIALMKESFPILRCLDLRLTICENKIYTTDAILGESAPLLQRIILRGIWFPGLPKLLSSASDLVILNLRGIPITGEGDISPDAMVGTCLSVLTKLEFLTIFFLRRNSSPYPTDQNPPPSTHTVLPALTYLSLEGPHSYLEGLVDRIDAPLLNFGDLNFLNEPIFDTPRVLQFIHRAKMFKLLGGVEVRFGRGSCFYPNADIVASFRSSIGPTAFHLSFPCSGLPAQVAIMERICAQWPSLVSHVESLKLGDHFWNEQQWGEAITPWLGFLRPFTAMQTLCFCGSPKVPRFVRMLGELKGRGATDLLPALRTIELGCSEEGVSEALRLLRPFLVSREESGHPVVVNFGSRS